MKTHKYNTKAPKLDSAASLAKSLDGCNLLIGLYGDTNDQRDLLIHAIAFEARDIILKLMRNTMAIHLLLLHGKQRETKTLFEDIAKRQTRLQALRLCCRKLLRDKKKGVAA